MLSAAQFEGNMAKRRLTYLGYHQSLCTQKTLQSSTTTLNKFEREGTTNSGNVAHFVGLDAITAGMDEEEALKPQRDGIGCTEFDFLLVDKEKADT
jgi:hypothetical protein